MSEFIERIEMLIRLKCLEPRKDDYGDENCYIAAASQHEEVCEHLKKIPPVDFAPFLSGQWVKASEKLPITIDPVIITWVNRVIEMEPEIGVAHYCGGKWHWYSSVSGDVLGEYGDSPDAFDDVIKVIAWMPLPSLTVARKWMRG